jgi:hypothetical protein
VKATDPATYILVALFLAAFAQLASFLPGARQPSIR